MGTGLRDEHLNPWRWHFWPRSWAHLICDDITEDMVLIMKREWVWMD